MKTVHQIDEIGCGIACVAMLGNVSYQEARTLLFKQRAIKLTSSGKLLDALRALGREPIGTRMISLKNINLNDFSSDCLLGALSDGDKHWVVWDCKKMKVRDPYRGDNKIKIVKYMQIR